MTPEQVYEMDDKLAKAIGVICRRAGGENDDPSPRFVREALRDVGLAIVPVETPTDEVWWPADEQVLSIKNAWPNLIAFEPTRGPR